jgi:hypothetical protein
MGAIQPAMLSLDHHLDHQNGLRLAELDSPEVWPELDALLEKSEQLNKLVTRLSNLVIRNVADRP